MLAPDSANPLSGLDGTALTTLVDRLVDHGWFVGERFFDLALCRALHAELWERAQSENQAGVEHDIQPVLEL